MWVSHLESCAWWQILFYMLRFSFQNLHCKLVLLDDVLECILLIFYYRYYVHEYACLYRWWFLYRVSSQHSEVCRYSKFLFFAWLRFMEKWYEYKTDNHQEKPSEYFFESNHMPYMDLWWIYPYFCVGCDILSKPYKQRNE